MRNRPVKRKKRELIQKKIGKKGVPMKKPQNYSLEKPTLLKATGSLGGGVFEEGKSGTPTWELLWSRGKGG